MTTPLMKIDPTSTLLGKEEMFWYHDPNINYPTNGPIETTYDDVFMYIARVSFIEKHNFSDYSDEDELFFGDMPEVETVVKYIYLLNDRLVETFDDSMLIPI